MEAISFTSPTWYTLTLSEGKDLVASLKDFFQRKQLGLAYVVSCIGSLEKVVLAFPKTQTMPPEVEQISLEGLFEINGISGNIKKESEDIKVHLHGSVSSRGREVSGGAIIAGTRVFKVAELLILGFKNLD